MRILPIALVVTASTAALVPVLFDQEPSAYADTVRKPAANPKSLASGAYLLVVNPKKIGGVDVKAKRPGIVPVVLKTDGHTVVMGGKLAPNMTGTITNGSLSLNHVPGASFSMTGSTFNGYAASGVFHSGKSGAFEGTFALVTVSKGGVSFMGPKGPGGTWSNGSGSIGGTSALGGLGGFTNGSGSRTSSSLSKYMPGGTNASWGYDGPGLSYGGGPSGNSAFNLPGQLSGANADGKDGFDWMHPIDSLSKSLDISGGDSGGAKGSSSGSSSGSNAPGSQKAARDRFANSDFDRDHSGSSTSSSSGGSGASSSSDTPWYCFGGLFCGGDGDSSSSSSSSSGGSSSGSGGFTAGDWEPAGGDTSPGQKPKTGNGQDTPGATGPSAGASTGGSFKSPVGGGDPSELFKPGGGDILNTNRLFNGASDPPVGANFGR